MSICPLCGRAMCDHTAEQRKQPEWLVHRPLTEDELKACQNDDEQKKRKYASGVVVNGKLKFPCLIVF